MIKILFYEVDNFFYWWCQSIGSHVKQKTR